MKPLALFLFTFFHCVTKGLSASGGYINENHIKYGCSVTEVCTEHQGVT